MSTSFPYLAVAKQRGVSYREVLAIVETLEKHGPYDAIWDQATYCLVEQAWRTEQERRKSVIEQEA